MRKYSGVITVENLQMKIQHFQILGVKKMKAKHDLVSSNFTLQKKDFNAIENCLLIDLKNACKCCLINLILK